MQPLAARGRDKSLGRRELRRAASLGVQILDPGEVVELNVLVDEHVGHATDLWREALAVLRVAHVRG